MYPRVAGSALVASSLILIALRAQDAPAPPPQAKGKGRAPAVDTLGEGPWDLKTERGPVHVSVVTKGFDHPWGWRSCPAATSW